MPIHITKPGGAVWTANYQEMVLHAWSQSVAALCRRRINMDEITKRSTEARFLIREMTEHIRDVKWEFNLGELLKSKRKVNKLLAQLIGIADKERKP